jgi:hypothetical protein
MKINKTITNPNKIKSDLLGRPNGFGFFIDSFYINVRYNVSQKDIASATGMISIKKKKKKKRSKGYKNE